MGRAVGQIKQLVYLVPIGLVLAGCLYAPSENRGEYHKAYELYRDRVRANPDNPSATAGLRRTAPFAAAYWQRKAYTAAEAENWPQAAAYHQKVLQIKPDELASILTLRQIARRHPKQVLLAYAANAQPVPTIPKPAQVTRPPTPRPKKPSAKAAKPKPKAVKAQPAPVERKPPRVKPKPVAAKPAPSAVRPKPAAVKPRPPIIRPKPVTVKPKPPTLKPRPKPVKSKLKPTTTLPAKPKKVKSRPQRAKPKPPATRPSRRPAARRAPINPYRQEPTVRYSRAALDRGFIMIARVSRKDVRYFKKVLLRDGLAFKVKDTDKRPLDADVHVYLRNKRIAKFKNLPPKSIISVIGESRRRYEIVIMDIYDPTETVTIGLRRPKRR